MLRQTDRQIDSAEHSTRKPVTTSVAYVQQLIVMRFLDVDCGPKNSDDDPTHGHIGAVRCPVDCSTTCTRRSVIELLFTFQ